MPPEDNISLDILWVNSNAGMKEAPRVLNSFFYHQFSGFNCYICDPGTNTSLRGIKESADRKPIIIIAIVSGSPWLGSLLKTVSTQDGIWDKVVSESTLVNRFGRIKRSTFLDCYLFSCLPSIICLCSGSCYSFYNPFLKIQNQYNFNYKRPVVPLEKQDKQKRTFWKGASELGSVTSGYPISKGWCCWSVGPIMMIYTSVSGTFCSSVGFVYGKWRIAYQPGVWHLQCFVA